MPSARLAANGRARWLAAARWAWAFGCALFLGHGASAFHFFRGWSHATAYRETARQTAELTGLHWAAVFF